MLMPWECCSAAAALWRAADAECCSWGRAGQPGCCDAIKRKQAASKIRHALEQQACLQAVKSVLLEAYGDKGAVTDELVQCILQPGLEVGCKMCCDKRYHTVLVRGLIPQRGSTRP